MYGLIMTLILGISGHVKYEIAMEGLARLRIPLAAMMVFADQTHQSLR
jgi:hypothetical protein